MPGGGAVKQSAASFAPSAYHICFETGSHYEATHPCLLSGKKEAHSLGKDDPEKMQATAEGGAALCILLLHPYATPSAKDIV